MCVGELVLSGDGVTEVEGYASLPALRVLVKGGSGCHRAESLGCR